MFKNLSASYNYAIFATIVLVIICLLIYEFRTEFHFKTTRGASEQCEKRTHQVRIKKDVIALDPNIFEIHLRHIKDTINTLNQQPTNSCNKTIKLLADAKKDTSSYIALNLYDTDIQPMYNKYLEDEKKTITDCSDSIASSLYNNAIYSEKTDAIRADMSDLVSNIDTIITAVRDNGNHDGVLDLTAVNSFTEGMYADQKQSSSGVDMIHMLDILNKKYDSYLKSAVGKNKESFVNNDTVYTNSMFWKWYDVAGTVSDQGDKTQLHIATDSNRSSTRVNTATAMERVLDGSQCDDTVGSSDAIARNKEMFDLPKNKSHNSIKMASSVLGINKNAFISQGIEREFDTTDGFHTNNRMPILNSRKPFADIGSVFADQFVNTRSSLFG